MVEIPSEYCFKIALKMSCSCSYGDEVVFGYAWNLVRWIVGKLNSKYGFERENKEKNSQFYNSYLNCLKPFIIKLINLNLLFKSKFIWKQPKTSFLNNTTVSSESAMELLAIFFQSEAKQLENITHVKFKKLPIE